MSDIHTARALNIAARGDGYRKTRYGKCYGSNERTVVCGRPNLPFGSSTHARAYLSHVPTAIYMAWHKGGLVGQLVRWRCGGTSQHFQLGLEPSHRLCHLCAVYSAAPQARVVVTVWSAT